MDKVGTQIQATFFNDAALKFSDEIKEGSIYKMSVGNVKMANKRYTTIPNDHCITFDTYSKIEEIHDDAAKMTIKGGGFNFTRLKEVADANQIYMIDFIDVLTEI